MVAVSYPYWQFAMDMARQMRMHFQLALIDVSRPLLTAMVATRCRGMLSSHERSGKGADLAKIRGIVPRQAAGPKKHDITGNSQGAVPVARMGKDPCLFTWCWERMVRRILRREALLERINIHEGPSGMICSAEQWFSNLPPRQMGQAGWPSSAPTASPVPPPDPTYPISERGSGGVCPPCRRWDGQKRRRDLSSRASSWQA